MEFYFSFFLVSCFQGSITRTIEIKMGKTCILVLNVALKVNFTLYYQIGQFNSPTSKFRSNLSFWADMELHVIIIVMQKVYFTLSLFSSVFIVVGLTLSLFGRSPAPPKIAPALAPLVEQFCHRTVQIIPIKCNN